MLEMLFVSLFLVLSSAHAATVNLYTDRPTQFLRPIAEKFKTQTGHEVNIVELPYRDLLKKLQAEGSASPADVIFTKDLVFQSELASLGFYQPMASRRIETAVASSMRDPKNLWAAVTFRVRTLVYASQGTDVSRIDSYKDLAQPEAAGRLCLRSSNSSYNEAWVAALIHSEGYQGTKRIISGMVENLATDVFKGDSALIEGIANGVCEMGLVNHYYLAQILAQRPNFPVSIKFLDQAGRGVHVNGSGVGLAKSSRSPQEAQEFIEFLFTDKVQQSLSESLHEYPAVQNLLPTSLIKQWGSFKSDDVNWSEVGKQIESARQLVKEVGYL